jgi:hypothetical protein
MNLLDILFFDIDGVLNSEQSAVMWHRRGRLNGGLTPGRHDFCPIAASNLLSLFEFLPNLRLVISSTWRNNRTIQELDQIMQDAGLKPGTVIGKTPRFNDDHCRGREIQDWLTRYPNVRRFAILDDDSDMAHLMPYLKHTSWRHGFMRQDMHDLVDYFMHPWKFTNFYTIEEMGKRKIWTHEAEIFRGLGDEMISVKYYGLGEPVNLLDQTLDQWALARFEKGSRDHHACFRKDRYDLMRFLGGDRGTSQSLDELTDEDYQD